MRSFINGGDLPPSSQLSHLKLDREGIHAIDNLELFSSLTHIFLQHNAIRRLAPSQCPLGIKTA